jgi:ribosomal small subunit protein bTHX
MGRGDKKSKKGKIWKGSYGVNRNKKTIKAQLKRVASKKSSEAGAADASAKPKRTAAKKKAE